MSGHVIIRDGITSSKSGVNVQGIELTNSVET